jgi:hypothetical protein
MKDNLHGDVVRVPVRFICWFLIPGCFELPFLESLMIFSEMNETRYYVHAQTLFRKNKISNVLKICK